MVEKPTQSICVRSATMREVGAAGQAAIEIVAMESSGGKESALREIWKVMENEKYIRGRMWEYFAHLEDASRERQEGVRFGSKSEVTQMWDVPSQMMLKGYHAMRDGSSGEFKERYREKGKSSEWTLERIREANENVAKDEIGRLGIVLEILRKSTDFLRRVIAPVAGMGGVTLSYIARSATAFHWRTTFGGYRRDTEIAERSSTAVGVVWCAEADTNGELPTECWCSSVLTPMTQRERTRRHKDYVKN